MARQINPDALIIGVVTRPHSFDGGPRSAQAVIGINNLRKLVDSLLIVPNDYIEKETTRDIRAYDAYREPNKVLLQAIQGITDIITGRGYLNVDFNDVKKIMKDSGTALIGIGRASGENRHIVAAEKAIHSPLLENQDINGANGILVNFTGSEKNLKYAEINEAMCYIKEAANSEATVKHGIVYDENCGDEIKITVIATNFKDRRGALATEIMCGKRARRNIAAMREHNGGAGGLGAAEVSDRVSPFGKRPEEADQTQPGDLSIPAYKRRKGHKNVRLD